MVMIWSSAKGISIETCRSDFEVYSRKWQAFRLSRKGYLVHRKKDSGEDLVIESKHASYIFEQVADASGMVVAIRKVLEKTTDNKVTYIPLDDMVNFRYKKLIIIEKS